MKDFKLEKAFMAVKAQRYDEALQAYEAALENEQTVEAWTGLGICKLFQLLGNQTMEEVIYCFQKAKEVSPDESAAIELQLLQYSTLVVEQGAAYAIALIEKIKEAESAAMAAAIVSGVAGGLALSSNSLKGSIISGSIAAASAGVSVGHLAEVNDAKSAGQITINMIDSVHKNLVSYLVTTNQSSEAQQFNSRVNELKELIVSASDAKSKNPNAWYNTGWVWFWLLIFWPVGVYGLIKRSSEKKK